MCFSLQLKLLACLHEGPQVRRLVFAAGSYSVEAPLASYATARSVYAPSRSCVARGGKRHCAACSERKSNL